MAAGIPVACSSGSSFSEIIGMENALFFSPLNTDDISTKIRTLLQDETLRKNLIEHGRAHAEKYSWGNSVKRLHEVYLENVAAKP